MSLSQIWIPGTHDAAAFAGHDKAVVGTAVDFMAR
jgi:hypothetical protein